VDAGLDDREADAGRGQDGGEPTGCSADAFGFSPGPALVLGEGVAAGEGAVDGGTADRGEGSDDADVEAEGAEFVECLLQDGGQVVGGEL
jgi:hypothetical protein